MTNYFEAWGVVKPHIFTSQSILFSRQGTLNKKQNKLINLKVANFCIAVFRMRKKRNTLIMNQCSIGTLGFKMLKILKILIVSNLLNGNLDLNICKGRSQTTLTRRDR